MLAIYNKFMRKKQQGFTFVEILVVVTIVLLLSTIAVSSYQVTVKKARDARRKADIEQVRSALEMYRSVNGSYPNVTGQLDEVLRDSLVDGGYLPSLPENPIDPTAGGVTIPYVYRATDQHDNKAYGYCISLRLETEDPSDSCTPESIFYNYGIKNP